MNVIDFEMAAERKKVQEGAIEGQLISPETIKLMNNHDLVDTMEVLLELVVDSETEEDVEALSDLLFDAIYETKRRLLNK